MADEIKLANPTSVVKLDLACGLAPKEGYEGVDLWSPKAKYRVDLFKYPWKEFADDSVDEIHCSHFVEHLPARSVELGDLNDPEAAPKGMLPMDYTGPLGKDFFFAFFDECYRILKHEGKMLVIVPCAKTDRAFQDPTHRRFIVSATFAYLWSDWRKANGLDHYRVNCNFVSQVNHTMPIELSARSPEVQQVLFNERWNQIWDYHATLTCVKPKPQ